MATAQLLILGNGFDLQCGLKSSYNDFFRNTILDTISENFGLKQTNPGMVYGFWEHLLFEYYQKYGEQNYRWCDIEKIIKDTLWLILFEPWNKDMNPNLTIFKKAIDISFYNYDPITEAETTEDPIRKYLLTYCVAYLNFIKKQKINYSDNDKKNLILTKLLQELHNFEKGFCKYIKQQIVDHKNKNDINTNYIINAVNLLAKLTKFTNSDFKYIEEIISKDEIAYWEKRTPTLSEWRYKNVNTLSKEFSKLKSIHILSFNYTALFDFLEVDSPCIYGNVHGKLCSKNCGVECTASNIIFGIDDALIQSQVENIELQLFSKTYRKMLDTNSPTSILPPNDGTQIEIKFYGHSLSEADYSYFQSIFDYYNIYSNNKVSLIFYFSTGHEQRNAIYNLINSYGKTLANKDQGKNMIHKLLLENRLKIVEI